MQGREGKKEKGEEEKTFNSYEFDTQHELYAKRVTLIVSGIFIVPALSDSDPLSAQSGNCLALLKGPFLLSP